MKNKFKIIETSDYILALSGEEIKTGDWIVELEDLSVWQIQIQLNTIISKYKKIIAYRPKSNAPELDLPLLPEIVVEDNVEELADLFSIDESKVHPADSYIAKKGFIEGYKAATKVYSEDDLREAYAAGWMNKFDKKNIYLEGFNNFVQSLKQPNQPKWLVVEMEYDCCNRYMNCKGCDATEEMINLRFKTTTNSQGKQVLVGYYE